MFPDSPHDTPMLDGPTLGKKAFWSRLLSTKTLILLTATLVVVHSCVLLPVVWERFSHRQADESEIALGAFRHRAKPRNASNLIVVEFDVHVSLLNGSERAGRLLFQRHKFKVQQSVEELLRNADDRDFVDPQLTELKRRLQETINATLQQRVISEVIVTGLVFQGAERAVAAPSQVGTRDREARGPDDVSGPHGADPLPIDWGPNIF